MKGIRAGRSGLTIQTQRSTDYDWSRANGFRAGSFGNFRAPSSSLSEFRSGALAYSSARVADTPNIIKEIRDFVQIWECKIFCDYL